MKVRLLKMEEACKYVSLHKNVIWDLIKQKKFPYVNISRGKRPVYRFDIKDLDKWIEKKKQQ